MNGELVYANRVSFTIRPMQISHDQKKLRKRCVGTKKTATAAAKSSDPPKPSQAKKPRAEVTQFGNVTAKLWPLFFLCVFPLALRFTLQTLLELKKGKAPET